MKTKFNNSNTRSVTSKVVHLKPFFILYSNSFFLTIIFKIFRHYNLNSQWKKNVVANYTNIGEKICIIKASLIYIFIIKKKTLDPF